MARDPLARRKFITVALLTVVLAGMGGLVSYSATLYRLFCAATGYGGTPRLASEASATTLDRRVTVRFNADVAGDLPWQFQPEQRELTLRLGEQAIAYYKAVNTSAQPVVGQAGFNVTPDKVGQYFNKIECFCFTEQKLEPGQTADMPVMFFVDPALAKDRNLDDITTITLSYTFFKVDKGAPVPASAKRVPGQAAFITNQITARSSH